MPRTLASLILFGAISLVALQSASAITISTGPVGNLGNASDPLGNLYGSVSWPCPQVDATITVGLLCFEF